MKPRKVQAQPDKSSARYNKDLSPQKQLKPAPNGKNNQNPSPLNKNATNAVHADTRNKSGVRNTQEYTGSKKRLNENDDAHHATGGQLRHPSGGTRKNLKIETDLLKKVQIHSPMSQDPKALHQIGDGLVDRGSRQHLAFAHHAGPPSTFNNPYGRDMTSNDQNTITSNQGAYPGSNESQWRQKQDKMTLYKLEKYFKFEKVVDSQIKEMVKWKENDLKGTRKTLYIKEIKKSTDLILNVAEQSRLEKLRNSEDRWPCLNFRKAIRKVMIYINLFALQIIEKKAFENLSISVILANSIQLMLEDPTKTDQTQTDVIVENVFLFLYTVEMVLKILGMGFLFNKGAYLRESWNILDFVIVASAYFSFLAAVFVDPTTNDEEAESAISLQGLRVFRVLRPLKTITSIKGLRILVQSVLVALEGLKETVIVFAFFLIIFAIGGTQLFGGTLKKRCVSIELGIKHEDDILCGGAQGCPEDYFCGKQNENPSFGIINFDHIFSSLLMVFQCITLEGWSEIQKMFQMTYNPFVVFYFVPLVFIGAFFLLNLMLAVINNSFNRTRQQQSQDSNDEAKKTDGGGGSGDALIEQSLNQHGMNNEIGISEFFIAKRAAKKMIEYLRARKAERAQEELMLKENGGLTEKEVVNSSEERSMVQNSALAGPLPVPVPQNLQQANDPEDESINERQFGQSQTEGQKASQEGTSALDNSERKRSGSRQNGADDSQNSDENKTIQEEEEEPEDENYSQRLAKFWEELNDASGDEAAARKIVESTVIGNVAAAGGTRLMAQQDLRRAQPQRNGNGNAADQGLNGKTAPAKIQTIGTGTQGPAHLAASLKKMHENASYNGMLTDSSRVEEQLGFEKVVAADHLQPQNQPAMKKDSHSDSGEHPFDLSFIHSITPDYPNYMSDDDHQKVQKSFDDLASSAIASDSSFHSKLDNFKTAKEAQDTLKRQTQKSIANPARQYNLKDVKKQFRRHLTSDFNKKDPMNDTQQSTFYGGNGSNKQPPDTNSAYDVNAQTPANGRRKNQFKRRKMSQSAIGKQNSASTKIGIPNHINTLSARNLSQMSNKTMKRATHKKKMIETYDKIDDTFLKTVKPKDPYQYIDKKRQKIEINPGVPYRSTSHDEVFELRNALQQRQLLSKTNQFISEPVVQEQEVDKDDNDYEEDIYLQNKYDAYQLKTRYEIKQEEQVDFESDDEDALILALQPYDTVMSVGYNKHLTHLPTKFVARRSDIIVSSTLSITLTPLDDGYKAKNLVKLDPEEIRDWVDMRQEFRAKDIYTAKIPEPGLINQGIWSPDCTSQSNFRSSLGGFYQNFTPPESHSGSPKSEAVVNMFGGNQNERPPQTKRPLRLLPVALLSEPLSHEKQALLGEEEKKKYNLQKGKHEATKKAIKKKHPHPRNERFDLNQAKKLFEGTYHNQDDDDSDEEPELIENKGPNLNNVTMYAHRDEDFNQKEQLKKFEFAFDAIKDEPLMSQINKNKGDEIPKEIREEFDLPNDMGTNLIDFNEVRLQDCQVKRKTTMWSGQDVLEINLNQDQSQWVTNYFNAVRVWPKGGMHFVKRTRVVLKNICKHALWDNFMTGAVLLNTITMALDRYGIQPAEEEFLTTCNTVFTWIFIFEMSTKLIALGPQKYLAERMNFLDGGVVMISIVEMIFMSGGGSLSAFRTVRVFRTFRVLRVARLLRALQQMQVIISVIQRSFSSFTYIALLLFVFIFIYALLGMQLFGGQFDFEDGKPRGNYDEFNVAFVTVFQILTMENWQLVMYDSMRSPLGAIVPVIFYISWIFIGNYILLNLFLAILIDAFLSEDEEFEQSEEQLEAEALALQARRELMMREKERRMRKLASGNSSMFKTGNMANWKENQKKKETSNLGKLIRGDQEELLDDIEEMDYDKIKKILQDHGYMKKSKEEKMIKESDYFIGIECKRSMYLFSKENWFRRKMYVIMKNKYFDNYIIMTLIILSSLKLGVDTYYMDAKEDSLTFKISYQIDSFFTFAFAFESIIKQIAMGIIMDEGSYLRESWNQLDCFIVVSSLMDFFLTGVDLPIIKVLRLLRTLRPLRFISHNKSMKMVVAALGDSVGSIFNVMIVVLVIWMMFGIFAINLFAGKMFYCSIGKFTYRDKYECNVNGGSWQVHDSNFDNIIQAMMTLFIVSSLEGWPDIMLNTVDATEVDQGPLKEYNFVNAYFFVVFIFIGSFFLMNMFTGVLFSNYEKAQKEEKKGYTQENLNWIDMQQMILTASCPHEISNKPDSPWRIRLWQIVQPYGKFDYFIMAAILLNMLQMALDFEGAPEGLIFFQKVSNYIFTLIFVVEAVLKLAAYGWSYFGTAWNKFDFFVVASSLVDVGLSFLNNESLEMLSVGPQLARVLRVLRVSRVLRLAGKSENLQILLQTIQNAVGSMMNVFGLLLLIFFMLATMGVFFFGQITEGEVIDEYKNFHDFDKAYLLLFAISTGEDWNLLMYDCVKTQPDCVEGKTCGWEYAPAYFIVFIMVVYHVMLNLFILVIIQQFDSYSVPDENPLVMFKKNLKLFQDTWIYFTEEKYRCVKIKEKQLLKFFTKLPPPIGMADLRDDEERKKRMLKMGIKSYNGYIYFNELLYRCMRRNYGNFKLNRKLQVYELIVQYRLYRLSMAVQNQAKVKSKNPEDKEEFLIRMQGNGSSVNPFLTLMYFRISFKTWKKSMEKEEARKAYDAQKAEAVSKAEKDGSKLEDFPEFEEEQIEKIAVSIEVEEEVDYTTEEDDETNPRATGKRLGTLSNNGSAEGRDSIKGRRPNKTLQGTNKKQMRHTASKNFGESSSKKRDASQEKGGQESSNITFQLNLDNKKNNSSMTVNRQTVGIPPKPSQVSPHARNLNEVAGDVALQISSHRKSLQP